MSASNGTATFQQKAEVFFKKLEIIQAFETDVNKREQLKWIFEQILEESDNVKPAFIAEHYPKFRNRLRQTVLTSCTVKTTKLFQAISPLYEELVAGFEDAKDYSYNRDKMRKMKKDIEELESKVPLLDLELTIFNSMLNKDDKFVNRVKERYIEAKVMIEEISSNWYDISKLSSNWHDKKSIGAVRNPEMSRTSRREKYSDSRYNSGEYFREANGESWKAYKDGQDITVEEVPTDDPLFTNDYRPPSSHKNWIENWEKDDDEEDENDDRNNNNENQEQNSNDDENPYAQLGPRIESLNPYDGLQYDVKTDMGVIEDSRKTFFHDFIDQVNYTYREPKWSFLKITDREEYIEKWSYQTLRENSSSLPLPIIFPLKDKKKLQQKENFGKVVYATYDRKKVAIKFNKIHQNYFHKAGSFNLIAEIMIMQKLKEGGSEENRINVTEMVGWRWATRGLALVMKDINKFNGYLDRTNDASLSRIALAAAKGLLHCHECGIIHSDFSIRNVFLTKDNNENVTAKVGDFGLSKLISGDGMLAEIPFPPSSYGTEGVIIPLDNSDPRCYFLKEFSIATDIYSFGHFLLELLYEEDFYRKIYENDHQKYFQAKCEPAFSVKILTLAAYYFPKRGRVSTDTEKLIKKCFDPDPRKRFGSMAEVVAWLTRTGISMEVKKKDVAKPMSIDIDNSEEFWC